MTLFITVCRQGTAVVSSTRFPEVQTTSAFCYPCFSFVGAEDKPMSGSTDRTMCPCTRAAMGILTSGMGDEKAEVKASKRKEKGVNTLCVSVVSESGFCNEDAGFCDLIKTESELCVDPQKWQSTSTFPPPHWDLRH